MRALRRRRQPPLYLTLDIELFSPFEEPEAPVRVRAVIDTATTVGLVVPVAIGAELLLPEACVEGVPAPRDAHGRALDGYLATSWVSSDVGQLVETSTFVTDLPNVVVGCALLAQWEATLTIGGRELRFPPR